MSKYLPPVPPAPDAAPSATMHVPKSRTHLLSKTDAVLAQRRRLARLDLQPIRPAPPAATQVVMQGFRSPPDAASLSVALIGIPNAGKSTLTNRLVASEVSIVTAKAQTTQQRMLGITTIGNTQLAFFDTPGTVSLRQQSKRRKRLQRSITQEASDAALDADLVCLVVDAARTWNDDSEDQLHRLRKLRDDMLSRRAQLAAADAAASSAEAAAGAQSATDDALFVLVMNKCDLVPLERAQRKAHLINQSGLFAKTFFLSAMRDNYVDQLRDYLVSRAVRREWDFPPEWVSDLSPMEMVEECIREQLLARLNQELPYHIKQRNLGWTDLEDGSLRIDQYLIVEHLRAKRIVVGANAGTIRVISDRARARIGERLKRTVHLFLTVKVEEPK